MSRYDRWNEAARQWEGGPRTIRRIDAEALCALNQCDINAQTIRNQHVMIQNRDREIEHLGGQIDRLARVLMEEFGGPDRDESACEMAARLLRAQRQRLADCEQATNEDTTGEAAFLDHVAEDTANSDGEPKVDPFRKIEALQSDVDFLNRELHAARLRQKDTADQLTDAFADINRLQRVIDALLDRVVPAVPAKAMAAGDDEPAFSVDMTGVIERPVAEEVRP